MTFGITDSGFTLKRLPDILTDQRNNASTIFKDLVQPGEIVDTSDSSALGRLINIFSLADQELWELGQYSYSSFDPNTSFGIALDNLVEIGGLSRQGASSSTATCLFNGDNGTSIDLGSQISSSTHTNIFQTTSLVVLNPELASGITISIFSVQDSADYTIDYTVGSSTNTVTYTSDSSATSDEILTGISAAITSSHPLLTVEIVSDTLVILKDDVFQKSTFSVSSNLSIDKCYKLGSVECAEVGPLAAEANSLTVIDTPVLGWDGVTNPTSASLGSYVETDEELRLRFRNTKFERSTNIIDSLYSAILNLETVESVTVYENDTDVVDSNGLPPHSFTAVVLGSDSESIANAIWTNKPIGITSNGNTTVEVLDIQGFPHDVKYQTPTPVPIYISMELTTFGDYPSDGAEQIKSAIISYTKTEFPVGADVIYSRLYTPINSVEGHQVNSLYIGTSPSPIGTSNISIDFDEIASFSSVNIDVTVA